MSPQEREELELQASEYALGSLSGDERLRFERILAEEPWLQQRVDEWNRRLGPLAVGGSASTVSKAEYSLFKPYDVTAGPSMRLIVDLASPHSHLTVIPGGQSGQPFSPHYKDQVELWRRGEYRRVTLGSQPAAAAGRSVLVLQPQRAAGEAQ